MYEREAVSLLEKKTVFVATVSGVAPQIRPMQAKVDAAGAVYLYCPASRRGGEIAINNQASVCSMDSDGSVLRLSGQLEPVAAATDELNEAAYRLRVHAVMFTSSAGDSYGQIQRPNDVDGILLQPDSRLTLVRR
ncbi:MAG: pyridoxamine 5'-phosphate oxidase family protein [Sporomusaceae bacterium]|nr:pyridoxamine 5'-phosphate oxidase family protein [Sporomusaceae bacterium]